MPLYLVAPGERVKYIGGKAYPNRYFLVRGEIGGRGIEVSAKTTDPTAAGRFKAELELRLLEDRVPDPGEEITFRQAVGLYVAFRDPSKADTKRLDRLKAQLGDKLLASIRQADLVDAANQLLPARAAATRNREVLRPAAAVLHYCARSGYCPWLRVELFREARPKTRAVARETAAALINSLPEAPSYQRPRTEKWMARARGTQRKKLLLLLWLFRQGSRISDALQVRGERIDMRRRVVSIRVGKTDEWIEAPLHDEVWEMLANEPPGEGWLFPWRSKSGVYKWLRPFARSLGIAFTPHMARHSLGKWLNEDGASLRTIMDTLNHKDVKSSARYQSTDIEVIRATGRRLGNLLGKKP